MAERKRAGPWVWLVVAAVLLGFGAWLMRGAEPPEPPPPPEIRLPRQQSRVESERAEERRTWVPVVVDAGLAPAPQRPRDPVLALVPHEVKEAAVVTEFNAIMNSDLGEPLIRCVFGDENDPFLARMRDAGVDPRSTIDRVAFVDGTTVMTGDFKAGGWKQFLPPNAVTRDYGLHAQIIEVPFGDKGQKTYMAAWNGQMLLQNEDRSQLEAMIDRVDSGGTSALGGAPAIDDSMAYGEVYGIFRAGAFSELLGESDPELAKLIDESASQLSLHMDVRHDVGMVADVDSKNPQKAEELRRALGGALSLGRMKARAEGKPEEAQLFDMARVQGLEDGQFRMEAGLPYEFMKKALDTCVENRKRRRAEAKPVE